jgi:hypothetical protein
VKPLQQEGNTVGCDARRARPNRARTAQLKPRSRGSWQQEPTVATNHADLPARMLWLVETALSAASLWGLTENAKSTMTQLEGD